MDEFRQLYTCILLGETTARNAIGAGDVVMQCADALLRDAAVRPYWTKVH